MNAKELMIGDWVVKPSGHISTMGREEFSNDVAWFENIQPIPLTPEILEKNEFQLLVSSNGKTIYSHLLGTEDCSSIIFLLIDEEKWKLTVKNCYSKKCLDFISFHNILHVHELQHSLRLCGFNEIADNFKV